MCGLSVFEATFERVASFIIDDYASFFTTMHYPKFSLYPDYRQGKKD